ncbi:type IX secretion system sortase PorU [candidate division KSB1 bacterium]
MKKHHFIILSILIISVLSYAQDQYPHTEILSSDGNGITFKFVTPDYKLKQVNAEGKTYSRFIFSDLEYTTEPGYPELPFRTVLIALPAEGDYSLTVTDKSTDILKDIILAPVPTYESRDNNFPVFKTTADKNIYRSANPVKEEFYEAEEISRIRDLKILKLKIYPVQFLPSDNRVTLLKSITIHIQFESGINIQKSKNIDNAYLNILNREFAADFEIKKTDRALSKPVLFEGDWYKIPVSAEGIYKIDRNWLDRNGINISSVDPGTIKIFNNGGYELPGSVDAPVYTEFNEIRILVSGEEDGIFNDNDYILFYGRGVDGWKWKDDYSKIEYYINHYAKQNIYWLNIGTGSPGKRIEQIPFVNDPSAFTITSYVKRYHFEEERFNIFGSGLEWLSSEFSANSFPKSYDFEIFDLVEGSPAKTVIRLKGGSEDFHSFNINLNDQQIIETGTFSWFSAILREESIQSLLEEGTNTLGLTYNSSQPEGVGYLDWFEIHYQRDLAAQNNSLKFENPSGFTGTLQFNLRGFANPSEVFVFDITKFDSVNLVTPEIEDNLVKIQDSPETGTLKTYFASGSESLIECPDAEQVTFANLKNISNGYDFIIISHDNFADACIPLKELRENEEKSPLFTRIFKISDIYNEFSFGLDDPIAIRNFLKYALNSWDNAPEYVLLVGDGHYDYKNNLGNSPPVYIPPFEIDGYNDLSTRATDDWYAYLTGNDYLTDIAIGRITSNSITETETIIDKIVKYDSEPEFGIWKSSITVVADDEFGNAGANDEDIHTDDTEDLANNYIPDIFKVNKLYLMEYEGIQSSSSFNLEKLDAAEDFIEMVNEGTLVINYFGHGTPARWAHEKLLIQERDLNKIKNHRRLPLWVVATCDFGHYDTPDYQSMTEELLSKADGGGIGVLSTNRAVYASPNAYFTKMLFKNMFDDTGNCIRIGDAVMLAKNSTSDLTNNQKFHIIGDPTLRIAAPVNRPDSLSISPDSMKALGKSTFGINTGQIIEGTAEIFVFNSKIRRTHVMPNNEAVHYDLPGGLIFRGSSEIKNGAAASEFIIPKDITYGGTDGRINVYYYNDETDGFGKINNIRIGGTAETEGDEQGPVVEIYYNNEPFFNGGIAEKGKQLKIDLFDENGINMTGEIGHCITLTIDNNLEGQSILNSYFSYEKNSYQKGSTIFSLDKMDPGFHTMTIKAWDNFNNSSVFSIDFEVIEGSDLFVRDVYNYPNPFKYDTYFTFRISQPAEIFIKVYTQFGRLIKKFENIIGTNGFNKIYWDGYDEDGDRIANGVYLYKVIAKDFNSGRTTESLGKLVIMR